MDDPLIRDMARAIGVEICKQFELQDIGKPEHPRIVFTLRGGALDFDIAAEAAGYRAGEPQEPLAKHIYM